MTTSQQHLVTVVIDGNPVGVFDTFSGGEASAEVAKHRPGGMVGENSYAALPTYGDVTVGRERDRLRDLELYRTLLGRVGRAQASLSKQVLDDTGAPVGKPFTYTGRLSGLSDPEYDSTSSDPSLYELTFVITDRA